MASTSLWALATMRSYSAWPLPRRLGLDLIGHGLRRGDDLSGLLTRGGEHLLTLVLGGGGVRLRLIRGLEGAANLLLAIGHGLVERRQDVLRDEKQDDHHDQEFDEERPVRKKKY